MTQASRVPAPRSPLDGRWGAAGAIAAGLVLILILKPWQVSAPGDPAATPWPTQDRSAVRPLPVSQAWDPASLGPAAPEPAWELWAADRVTRIRFVGPDDGFNAAPSVRPDETAVIGGPVIELGGADGLTAFAVNRPADVTLGAVRLWRFVTGAQPVRIELVELADPWDSPHVRVFGPRAAGAGRSLAPWEPGLYRLDLLIEPVDRIRTLLLSVEEGSAEGPVAAGPSAPPDGATAGLDVRLLRRLPPAAHRWAFGQLLVGWSGEGLDSRPTCRVAEIWRARDVDDGCHPTPVGSASALGVNLPDGERVVALDVRAVDPLPGPAAATVSVAIGGRPGLAMARADDGRFPDGIYRISARTASGGEVGWYAEVGPDDIE